LQIENKVSNKAKHIVYCMRHQNFVVTRQA